MKCDELLALNDEIPCHGRDDANVHSSGQNASNRALDFALEDLTMQLRISQRCICLNATSVINEYKIHTCFGN